MLDISFKNCKIAEKNFRGELRWLSVMTAHIIYMMKIMKNIYVMRLWTRMIIADCYPEIIKAAHILKMVKSMRL